MKKKYIIGICAVCIIVLLLGGYAFSEYSKANQYAEDMQYYFDTVLTNNAYMSSKPTNTIINDYIEQSRKCKNDADFLNLLLEANTSFGDAGHLFPLLPENYYYRLYTYEAAIESKNIDDNNTLYVNLCKPEVLKAYDSVSDEFLCDKRKIKNSLSQQTMEKSNDNIKFTYIKDTLFITIKSFNFEYYMYDIEKIRKELEKYEGDRIVFDVRDNGGGTGYYFLDLISMTKNKDFRCEMTTYGRGDILTNYLKNVETNLKVEVKDDEIILTDNLEIKSSHEFDFDKIYIIVNENS